MKTVIYLCVQILHYLSFAATLVYFAIDFRSGQSKISFGILIFLSITDGLLRKIYGKESETFLEGKFAQLVMKALLLVLVLVMYWQVEPSDSYLFLFGALLVSQLIEAMKMKRDQEEERL